MKENKAPKRITDIDKIIGNKIRILRKSLNISNKDLAAQIGISNQQLVKYETQSNRISIGRLLLICKRLNVTLNYFFDEFELSNNNDPIITFGMDFMKLKNPKHQEAVNVLVRALI